MESEDSVKTYVLKLYHLYQYLGFSDYQLLNFINNCLDNPYSNAYKTYQRLDEFKLVKFCQLAEGPIAYTQAKDRLVAIQRFKDDLIPMSRQEITQTKFDDVLFSNMVDNNTQEADDKLIKLIKH